MINNEFYKDLGDSWWESRGDAVALLRIENRAKAPWVIGRLGEFGVGPGHAILDIGCGGGFLCFELARAGYKVTGLDVDDRVFAPARRRRGGDRIDWIAGSALKLPFADGTFSAVCLMDVLEHLDDPKVAVKEAWRVLQPDGVLLMHTFNRNRLAWLLADQALRWFIRGAPGGGAPIHDWRLFIRPSEIRAWLKDLGAGEPRVTGIRPRIFTRAFARLLWTRRVPEDFAFRVGGPPVVGYLVAARKLADRLNESDSV